MKTGHVLYLAGYCQDKFRTGQSPVWLTARVEQAPDGTCLYYPSHALSNTTDGGLQLPPELLETVIWE